MYILYIDGRPYKPYLKLNYLKNAIHNLNRWEIPSVTFIPDDMGYPVDLEDLFNGPRCVNCGKWPKTDGSRCICNGNN